VGGEATDVVAALGWGGGREVEEEGDVVGVVLVVEQESSTAIIS